MTSTTITSMLTACGCDHAECETSYLDNFDDDDFDGDNVGMFYIMQYTVYLLITLPLKFVTVTKYLILENKF